MTDEERMERALTRAGDARRHAEYCADGLSEPTGWKLRDLNEDRKAEMAEDIAWIIQKLTGTDQ